MDVAGVVNTILTTLAFPIVILLIGKFVEEYLNSKKYKERYASWLRVLNTSSEINKCFSELESRGIYIKAVYKGIFKKKFNLNETLIISKLNIQYFLIFLY